MRLQVRWTDIQPDSETQFDWSSIDTQLASAQTYNKQLGLSLVILSSPPSWLTALPGVTTYLMPPTKKGKTASIVLPWNPVVQQKIIAFITQLCQRYDGSVDYIVMGGMGFHTETYFPTQTDLTPPLPITLAEEAALWIQSSELLIDTYAANLHSTPFIMAGGITFPNDDPSGSNLGTDSITTVFNHGLQYGVHFGLMQWGLNVNSNTSYIINGWIYDYSPTNPVGLQFTGNSAGTVGGDLGCVGQSDCVSQVLDVGVGLRAQWIEVYPVDADNSALAPTFEDHAAAMSAPPPAPPDQTPTPTPTPKPTPTPEPTPTPTPPPPSQYLLNLSTRVHVQSGDDVMIGGFIIAGDANKSIIIRALGPSLSNLGVKRALTDPVLEVYDSTGASIAFNDNWTSLPSGTVPLELQPTNPAESVIVINLPPGSYTAILRSGDSSTGNALCELYDLSPGGDSSVLNISTRGVAGTGDDVMIGGFIVGGTRSANLIVRAIGPSLTAAGVSGALADPVLELYDSQGSLIAQNDNWRSNQEQQIIDTHVAPSNNKEAAIVATLPPAAYTAVVRGARNSTGVALVEVYSLDP